MYELDVVTGAGHAGVQAKSPSTASSGNRGLIPIEGVGLAADHETGAAQRAAGSSHGPRLDEPDARRL